MLSRFLQLFRRTNRVFLQQCKNLPAFISLGDGHRHNLSVRRGAAQGVYHGVVVIHTVQLEGARADLLPRAGQIAVEVEQPGIADQPRIRQLLGDLLHGVRIRNGHRDHLFLFGQGQHVVRPEPYHPGQGHTYRQYDAAQNQRAEKMGNPQKPRSLFLHGRSAGFSPPPPGSAGSRQRLRWLLAGFLLKCPFEALIERIPVLLIPELCPGRGVVQVVHFLGYLPPCVQLSPGILQDPVHISHGRVCHSIIIHGGRIRPQLFIAFDFRQDLGDIQFRWIPPFLLVFVKLIMLWHG